MLRERIKEAVIEIGSELDGPVGAFGRKLKTLLEQRGGDFARTFAKPFTHITYSDRYLFSPVVARLATELVTAFADHQTQVTFETLASRKEAFSRYAPTSLSDDWLEMRDRDRVLEALLKGRSGATALRCPPHLAHRRKLAFKGPQGSGSIFFDQGVGSWRPKARRSFDFGGTVDQQARALASEFDVLNSSGGTFIAIRLD